MSIFNILEQLTDLVVIFSKGEEEDPLFHQHPLSSVFIRQHPILPCCLHSLSHSPSSEGANDFSSRIKLSPSDVQVDPEDCGQRVQTSSS